MSSNPPPIDAEQRRAWASWVAGHRRQVEGTCKKCGTPFIATSRRRYCSLACRVSSYRAARKLPESS